MTRSYTPDLNGLRLSFVERRLHVDYLYPGTIDVQITGGVRLKTTKDAGSFELGRFDHAARAWFEESRWTWNTSKATPRARVWVQNVLAAHEEQVSRSYEHDGELVLIWHRLPTPTSEQALLAAGFQPSLATWRAAPSDKRRAVVRALLANESVTPDAYTREQTSDADELKRRAQHAWMRWSAVFQDTLVVGGRTYKVAGRPTLRDKVLVLVLHHSSGAALHVHLDVSKHPLRYPVSVDGSVTLSRDAIAWEDFPALAEEIGATLDARRKTQRAATEKPAKKKAGGRGKRPIEPVRPRELHALPPATPTMPTWADRFLDAFNADPGPELAFSRRRGDGTLVFAIHAETRPDRPLAAIDIRDERIHEIRWLDEGITPAQRTALTERLERALAGFRPDLADSLSHAALEKLKARALALGADPDRTARGEGGEEYRWLAETLRDLAGSPRGFGPDDLADWLSAHSLRSAAAKVRRHSDEQPLGEFLVELWDQIGDLVVLSPVEREGDSFAVHPQVIHESDQGPVIVLREAETDGRPRVVSVRLREDCEEDRCIVDSDELSGDERAWHLGVEWDYRFVHDLYHHMRSFEQSVRAAPARLADVREMLFWTAAMLDTPRCRGESRRIAEVAFGQANLHYDRARVLVAEGDSIEGLQAIHATLHKIVAAAAELAQSCAEGQTSLPGTPGALLRAEMRAPRTWAQARRADWRRGTPRITASASPPEPPRRHAAARQYEDPVLAWAERFLDDFNSDAGPELLFLRLRDGTLSFKIHAEGRPDRPFAVFDIRDERIHEFRWLGAGLTLTSAQQTTLTERLERALSGFRPDRLPLSGGDVEAEDQFVLDAFRVPGFVPELVPHLPWGFELVLYHARTKEKAVTIDVIDRETVEFHWHDNTIPGAMRDKIAEEIDRVLLWTDTKEAPRPARQSVKPPKAEAKARIIDTRGLGGRTVAAMLRASQGAKGRR